MMSDFYDFNKVEEKWQTIWAEKTATPDLSNTAKPEFYCLVMFPYPSGKLHMGHVRNYVLGDVMARYKQTRGFNVFHPIGWDAFGLPAENAAIQHKIHPDKWTRDNINQMKKQLIRLGISYNWHNEIATCDPEYYRWNQWFFLKMLEKGLAYRKKAQVNWCESCATVLANEQVHDGQCWRCGTQVSLKDLEQWFFRITAYAEELLSGHDELANGNWPDEVLAMQRNWIGKSSGATIVFQADGHEISVFTTRPDTVFGATFMVMAPEHPLVASLTIPSRKNSVLRYVAEAKKRKKDKSVTPHPNPLPVGEGGVNEKVALANTKEGEFLGSYATNPVNGKQIPIWVAEYVLMEYGSGAIMAVPAHDNRDYEFAVAHRLEIIEVVKPDSAGKISSGNGAYEGEGAMVNSAAFDGLHSETAKTKIVEWLASRGTAQFKTTYKLRDWLISRQRYWGTPIPVVHCDFCGIVPVPEPELPVMLPQNILITGAGESPLARTANFLDTTCPKCKGKARREPDTMDTFVDSSWYYARYLDPKNKQAPFDSERANRWLPVDQYIGGIEHACMHLIYSRFFHKVARDLGLVQCNEPFQKLLTQGMVTLGGSAMSKSRGNVVEPSEIISRYGTDTCRLFILFAAPPRQQLEWSDTGVQGMWRFLNRVWRLAVKMGERRLINQATTGEFSPHPHPHPSPLPEGEGKIKEMELTRKIHQTIKRVTEDIERDFGFNTAIASLMELTNTIYAYNSIGDSKSRKGLKTLARLLYPFAPHIAAELLEMLEPILKDESASPPDAGIPGAWPEYDPELCVADEIEIAVQINGKVRDRITINKAAVKDEALQVALVKPVISAAIHSKTIKNTIYVPGKLVNIVIGDKNNDK